MKGFIYYRYVLIKYESLEWLDCQLLILLSIKSLLINANLSGEAERLLPFETIHNYLKNVNVTNTQGIDFMMLHSIFDYRGKLQSSGMWLRQNVSIDPLIKQSITSKTVGFD